MPQLMPLMWILSIGMWIMLLGVLIDLYYNMNQEIYILENDEILILNYQW